MVMLGVLPSPATFQTRGTPRLTALQRQRLAQAGVACLGRYTDKASRYAGRFWRRYLFIGARPVSWWGLGGRRLI